MMSLSNQLARTLASAFVTAAALRMRQRGLSRRRRLRGDQCQEVRRLWGQEMWRVRSQEVRCLCREKVRRLCSEEVWRLRCQEVSSPAAPRECTRRISNRCACRSTALPMMNCEAPAVRQRAA
jgi:hypothetical protein